MPMKYQEAVREGRILAESVDRNNWRLGEIADQLEPVYGDKTLERFADDIGMNYQSLKYCKATYRAWPHHNRRPKTWSVAKALIKHPQKYHIIETEPDITVSQAILAMEQFKERRSVGKYKDYVIHKIVADLVKIFNGLLAEDSSETKLLKELILYNETDLEYIKKVVFSMHDARERIDNAIKMIQNPNYLEIIKLD
jgi:hypothetical protein